jgi:flagellar motor switch protein FliG
MQIESVTGVNRAAVLLICLGEQAAAKIFAELSDDEVKRISNAMSAINHIPAALKEKVMAQYREERRQASGQFVKGSSFARNAISALDDSSRTDTLLQQYEASIENRYMGTITKMKPKVAADLLEKEHSQTIALILSTQPTNHAAAILSYPPEELQADIVYRIGSLERVSADTLKEIEAALQRDIGLVAEKEERIIGGLDQVVGLLGKMKNNMHSKIIDKIGENDDQMAEKIRRKMFTFDSLINLDGRSLQMILREVNNESLALALKNASVEIKERIFANMSPRAADMIRDDLEAMGPVRVSEVEAMQQSIVKIAMQLEQEGKFLSDDNDNVLA